MSAKIRLSDALRGHDSIRAALNGFFVEQIELGRDELERDISPADARARIALARELQRKLKVEDEKDIHHGAQAKTARRT